MTAQRVDPAEPKPSTVLGMSRAALVEVLVFFAAALVLDALAFDGSRFR